MEKGVKMKPRHNEKLALILNEFEPGMTNTDMLVNRILLEFNEDVAQLRRDLVDYGYGTRVRYLQTDCKIRRTK